MLGGHTPISPSSSVALSIRHRPLEAVPAAVPHQAAVASRARGLSMGLVFLL